MWIQIPILLCLFGLLASTKGQDNETDVQDVDQLTTQATVQASFTVGVVLDPPFLSKLENGTYEGLLQHLYSKMAEEINLPLEFVELSSQAEVLEQLNAQNIDAASMIKTADTDMFVMKGVYMADQGYKILTNRPSTVGLSSAGRLFVYFRPFSVGSWAACGLCTLVVGLVLYLLKRCHPKDNGGQVAAPSVFGEGRRLADSFWWICRSFNLQGVESRPKSIASRIVAVAWIMFILDSMFIYLSALMTNMPLYYGPHPLTPNLPFNNIPSLLHQNAYLIRSVEDFRGSLESSAEFSDAVPAMKFCAKLEHAIGQLKRHERTALLINAKSAAYYANLDCDLVTFGSDHPHDISYGIAVSKTMEDDQMASIERVIQTINKDTINMYFNPSNPTCGPYSPPEDPTKNVEVIVGIDGYGGPVVMLVLCLLVALVVAIVEVLILRKRSQKYDVEDPEKDAEQQPMLEVQGETAVEYEGKEGEEKEKEEEEGEKKDAEEKDSIDEEMKMKEEDKDNVKGAFKDDVKEDAEEKKEEEIKDTKEENDKDNTDKKEGDDSMVV